MARIEPKLEGAEQLEAVEKALTNFAPDRSFAPESASDQRGIHELVAELDQSIARLDAYNRKAMAALDEQVKNIKARLERFNHLQSMFYNGNS